jgi:hypothetical protein
MRVVLVCEENFNVWKIVRDPTRDTGAGLYKIDHPTSNVMAVQRCLPAERVIPDN